MEGGGIRDLPQTVTWLPQG